MKISLAKNLVNLVPESADERMKLEALWRTLIDCNTGTRSLTPIGEFVLGKSSSAHFIVEGNGAETLPEFPTVRVEEDCTVYCSICNRFQELKRGERIPPCCGKLMDLMD